MRLTKEQLEQWRPQIDRQEYVAGSAFIGHTLTLGHLLDTIDALELELAAWKAPQTPYPWCRGNPTKEDCAKAGYCKRDPNCGE